MLYVYYTQMHMMEEYGSEIASLQNIQMVKNQILDNAITKHQKRQSDEVGQGLTDKEHKIVEDLVYGDSWVNTLNQRKQKEGLARGASYQYDSLATLISQLKSDIKVKGIDITTFTKELNNFITTVEKEYEEVIRTSYVRSVFEQFKNNSRIGSKSSSVAGSNLHGRILETLRGRYQGKAFRVVDNVSGKQVQDRINVSLGKLATLSRMLNSSGGKQYLAQKGENAFWDDVKPSVLKWLDDFDALLEEMGLLAGAEDAVEKSKGMLEEADSSLKLSVESTHRQKAGRGDLQVRGKLTRDKRLMQDLERMAQLGGKNPIYGMFADVNQPKADSVVRWQDGYVRGEAGLSVKKSEDISFDKLANTANIHIQSSTPLLTLMLREAEMSYDDVNTAMNIAAALPIHPSLLGENVYKEDSTYESTLESTWQNLIKKLKYQSFYTALAGLGGTNERVYFMSLNGSIFSIYDLLVHFRNSSSSLSWEAYAGKKAVTSGQGLLRSAYQEINKNAFVEGPRSKHYGQYRSDKVRPSLLQLMQDTKINISMNIAQISALI